MVNWYLCFSVQGRFEPTHYLSRRRRFVPSLLSRTSSNTSAKLCLQYMTCELLP